MSLWLERGGQGGKILRRNEGVRGVALVKNVTTFWWRVFKELRNNKELFVHKNNIFTFFTMKF